MASRRSRYLQFVGSGLAKSAGDLVVSGVTNSNLTSGAFAAITAVGTLATLKVSGSTTLGGTATDASAVLNVLSTSKGLLLPRLTTTQRNAISSPTNGLLIYNSTTNKVQARANGAWVDLH